MIEILIQPPSPAKIKNSEGKLEDVQVCYFLPPVDSESDGKSRHKIKFEGSDELVIVESKDLIIKREDEDLDVRRPPRGNYTADFVRDVVRYCKQYYLSELEDSEENVDSKESTKLAQDMKAKYPVEWMRWLRAEVGDIEIND